MTDLYAIVADHSAGEITFMICTEQQAMDHGVFVAAHDLLEGYGSPTATVYRVGPVTEIGTAKAAHAPDEWEWARAVHGALAAQDQDMANIVTEERKREH